MKTNENVLELLAKNINPINRKPFDSEFATNFGIDIDFSVEVALTPIDIEKAVDFAWKADTSAVKIIEEMYKRLKDVIPDDNCNSYELMERVVGMVMKVYDIGKSVSAGAHFVPFATGMTQISFRTLWLNLKVKRVHKGPGQNMLSYGAIKMMMENLINPHTGYLYSVEYFYGFGGPLKLKASITKANDPHYRYTAESSVIEYGIVHLLKDMFPKLVVGAEGYFDTSTVKVYDSLLQAAKIIRARVDMFKDGRCTLNDIGSEFDLPLDKQLTITYRAEFQDDLVGLTGQEKPKGDEDLTPMELIAKFFPGKTIRFIHGSVPVFMRTRVGHESELVIKVKRKGRIDGQTKMVVKPGTTRIETFTEILGNIGYLLKDDAVGLIECVHHAAATVERKLNDKHLNLIAGEGNLEGRFIQPDFHCKLTEDLELFFEFSAVITIKVKKEEKPLETMTELMTGFNAVNELNGKICIGVSPINSVISHTKFVQLVPGKPYAEILDELVEVVTKETHDRFMYLQDDRWLKDFLLLMVKNNLALGMELPTHHFSITERDDKYALDVTACIVNPL